MDEYARALVSHGIEGVDHAEGGCGRILASGDADRHRALRLQRSIDFGGRCYRPISSTVQLKQSELPLLLLGKGRRVFAVGTGANGQATAISTQIQAPVDSVDLTQSPPLLSVAGQNFTLNQIQKIVR